MLGVSADDKHCVTVDGKVVVGRRPDAHPEGLPGEADAEEQHESLGAEHTTLRVLRLVDRRRAILINVPQQVRLGR